MAAGKGQTQLGAGQEYRFDCGLCEKEIAQPAPPVAQWVSFIIEPTSHFQMRERETRQVQLCTECSHKIVEQKGTAWVRSARK